jgi:hypothetical protein
MNLATIPSVLVPINYTLDSETEVFLYGHELAPGMVVLLEYTLLRHDPANLDTASPAQRSNILETARWCRIEQLRMDDEGMVLFTGIYHDGSERERTYNSQLVWYVKKDSVPS